MSHRRHLAVLAALASAVPALAAPGAAQAAGVPCFKSLPGPGAGGWQIQQDGSQDISHSFEGGSNFDAGHGALQVNGEAYPLIPDAEKACFTTETSILYPQKEVGGLLVRRRVNSIDGRIRRVDTLTNTSDGTVLAKVDFEVRVLGSQVAIESTSGDAAVTTADSWSVHANDGGSNPFLQWGEQGEGFGAIVISHGDNPNVWQQKAGAMPDATLQYFDLPVPAHSTVRLLHMNGTSGSAAASETAAKDRLTPFEGLSRHDASQVVNWGDDPDGDGVGKDKDECPGVNGNQPDGCFTLEAKPVDKTPPPAAPPADQPPAPAPAPAPPAAPPAAVDTRAPSITITKLRRSVRRSRLTRKGLAPRIACDEACSITVTVSTRRRGRLTPKTVLATTPTPLSTTARKVRLKLKRRHLRRLVFPRASVVVTATDAAGNRRSVTRLVRFGLRGARR